MSFLGGWGERGLALSKEQCMLRQINLDLEANIQYERRGGIHDKQGSNSYITFLISTQYLSTFLLICEADLQKQ